MCAALLSSSMFVLTLKEKEAVMDNAYFQTSIIFLAMILFIIFFTWIRSKSIYKSNSRLAELITFNFTAEDMEQIGDSFSSRYNWEKLYKIRTVKDFLLVYHSKGVMNIIRVPSEETDNINTLKSYLKNCGYKVKIK
jgi:hypothetical protein